jgi:hypothetical protein
MDAPDLEQFIPAWERECRDLSWQQRRTLLFAVYETASRRAEAVLQEAFRAPNPIKALELRDAADEYVSVFKGLGDHLARTNTGDPGARSWPPKL